MFIGLRWWPLWISPSPDLLLLSSWSSPDLLMISSSQIHPRNLHPRSSVCHLQHGQYATLNLRSICELEHSYSTAGPPSLPGDGTVLPLLPYHGWLCGRGVLGWRWQDTCSHAIYLQTSQTKFRAFITELFRKSMSQTWLSKGTRN